MEGSDHAFEGRVVVRLASVYGGLYDQPERLIPSLAVNSLTDTVIDAIDFVSKDFDFVHIADVVASIRQSVSLLEKSKGYKDDFLICCGHSTTALDMLTMIQKFTRSQSPIRKMASDSRYPSKFHCDNRKMVSNLHKPIYSDMEEGIGTYLQEIYRTNMHSLSDELARHCGHKRALDVLALDGCQVIITVLHGPNYLSSSRSLLKRFRKSKTQFTLTPINPSNNSSTSNPRNFLGDAVNRTVFVAYSDKVSGGFKLFATLNDEFMVVNEDMQIASGQTDEAVSVSIWPYSCPPGRDGKARLPGL